MRAVIALIARIVNIAGDVCAISGGGGSRSRCRLSRSGPVSPGDIPLGTRDGTCCALCVCVIPPPLPFVCVSMLAVVGGCVWGWALVFFFLLFPIYAHVYFTSYIYVHTRRRLALK